MTPWELKLHIDNYVKKEKQRQKEIVTLAYYIEGFARQKKLPKLEKLINDIDKTNKKAQTTEEMLETVKRLNKMLGGDVVGDCKKSLSLELEQEQTLANCLKK